MTKKSPPLFPFSVSTRPAGMSTSSAREAMKASSLSEQLAKRGTERNLSMRASATAGSLAAEGHRDPTNHFVGLFWLVAATCGHMVAVDGKRLQSGGCSAVVEPLVIDRLRLETSSLAVGGELRTETLWPVLRDADAIFEVSQV